MEFQFAFSEGENVFEEYHFFALNRLFSKSALVNTNMNFKLFKATMFKLIKKHYLL